MEKIPAASHLTDDEYELLLKVHAHHNRSMGIDLRKDHTLLDIVKVERNITDKCLHVHYKNGDWWHYSVDGSWY